MERILFHVFVSSTISVSEAPLVMSLGSCPVLVSSFASQLRLLLISVLTSSERDADAIDETC